jgi:alkylation response protein AidB-like acyl-CoA dehydrogenase
VDVDLLPGGAPWRAEVRAAIEGRDDPARLDDLTSTAPGYDPDLWAEMGRAGWLTRCAPPPLGENRLRELAVLLEELGRARVPTPVQNGLVQSAWAAAGAVGDLAVDVPTRWRGITDGTTRTALCLAGPSGRCVPGALGVTAHRVGRGLRLDGIKRFVPYADSADVLLVVADGPGPGVSLVAVDPSAAGVTIEPAPSIAGDRQAEIRVRDVHVRADAIVGDAGGAWPGISHAVLVGTVALCAEAVGASAALVERTVSHALGRVQSGRPIGALPVVQVRTADMVIDHLAAVGAVDEAFGRLEAGAGAEPEVAAAKAMCGSACLRVAASAHQIWGGTGYLADAGIHHWTRLIKGIDVQLGGGREQRAGLVMMLRERRAWSTHP